MENLWPCMRTYTWITTKTALHKIAIELLCPSIVAKGEEYAVSGNVRQLNIDNFRAACNGRSIWKHYVRA